MMREAPMTTNDAPSFIGVNSGKRDLLIKQILLPYYTKLFETVLP
jgi:hypothetical protein